MKISWTSLKVSITGAKLSHLVQKDKIWDHGSMTEQVKNIFYLVEKAKQKREAETLKKYASAKAFEQLDQRIKKMKDEESIFKNAVITEIAIVQVKPATSKTTDHFTALVKGKRKDENSAEAKRNHGVENFSERWHFIRQGDWWLLDEIK